MPISLDDTVGIAMVMAEGLQVNEREKNAISRCLSKKYCYKWNRICEPIEEAERKTKGLCTFVVEIKLSK